MDIIRAIVSKFTLPFFGSRGTDILDVEFNTVMFLRLKKLKAGHIMNKEEGNKLISDINALGRKLGKLEESIKKKQKATDIGIEEAMCMLQTLGELEDHFPMEGGGRILNPGVVRRLDFLEEDQVEKEGGGRILNPGVSRRLDFLEEDQVEQEEDSNESIRVTINTLSERLRMLEDRIGKDEEDRRLIRTVINTMFERLTKLFEHCEAVSKSMDKLWNMILEANNDNRETRSMSMNAFGATDSKFQDLSYQIHTMEQQISALKQLQTMPKAMPFHRVPAIIPLQQMSTPLRFQLPGTSDARDIPASTNVCHSTTVTDASHGPTSTDASHGPTSTDPSHILTSTNVGHSTTVTDASHGPTSTDPSHSLTSTNVGHSTTVTDASHGPTSTDISHTPTSTNATNNPASTNASHDLRSTSNLYANKKNMRAEGQDSGARRDHC